MIKVKNNLAPGFMKNYFSFKTFPYSLRNSITLQCRSTKTVLCGSKTTYSLGTKMWAILPSEMRNTGSFDELKKKIQ